MDLIPRSLHKLNSHRDNRTFSRLRRKGKNAPMTVRHVAETRSSKGAVQQPCHRTMANTLPNTEPKKPTLRSHTLLPGILWNSADFGSRGHGSMQVLLVEPNILRSRKGVTNWKISALKEQFEICTLKICSSPPHRAFLVLLAGPAWCPVLLFQLRQNLKLTQLY